MEHDHSLHPFFKKCRKAPEKNAIEIENSGVNASSVAASVSMTSGLASGAREFVDLNSLPADPPLRKKITEYHPNQINEIRRAYLLKGPCQPRGHDFPLTNCGGRDRRFNVKWFDEHSKWLEYSTIEDKAYCLCCYLFRNEFGNQGSGGAFVSEGFSSWNKTERLKAHDGMAKSSHNLSLRKCGDLMKQERSIEVSFHKHTDVEKRDYLVRLSATINLCRVMLHQGFSFRGNDESDDSLNKGNFIALLEYSADISEAIRRVVLENAPKNQQMTSPKIQKDVIKCFAKEIQQRIVEEFKDDYFALLVDESSDVSGKEQMAVVFRFVDSRGNVKERFIGVVHVTETSSLILKSAIDGFFADLGLSAMKIRGQGYDGASNMNGEFNGLKTLILRENESAHYIHCFSHQLQLALVGVARKHKDVEDFFYKTSMLVTVVGASCKRKDMIRQSQRDYILEGINSGLIDTGKGLNQELSLKRAGDTRWGSHHDSLINLVNLFSTVLDVLTIVSSDATHSTKEAQADGLLNYLLSFDFVFYLQLMLEILKITNVLSQALQKKEEDIVNAMIYVKHAKCRLQELRDHGWEYLLNSITSFCNEHGIDCLKMDDEYGTPASRRRNPNKHITNDFHYRVECFYGIVDMQLLMMNERFNEITSELLICIGSLSPLDNFAAFDLQRLIKLTEFYPNDFSYHECETLKEQLETYIMDMRSDIRFSKLNGIGDLSTLLVQTKKHMGYYLVYRLLKLALVLPVATASVERSFSAMTLVKTDLRNRMSDEFLNDCLICNIEKDLLRSITTDVVIK